tara:strand:- start:2094 stop:2402 length:309 start_codon:yes stop_codon:yes gene_type:complete
MNELLNDHQILAAITVYALLQLADVYLTLKGLRMGATEANGIMAKIIEFFGPLWPFVKLAIAGYGVYTFWQEGLIWAIWLANVVYLLVVRHNYNVVREMEER